MPAQNPLAARRATSPADHPVMHHAKVWQHVNGLPPGQQSDMMGMISHALPIMGALASDPNVTRKDVIKAAAGAAGSGKIPASEAVSFISQMPQDDDKLSAWLKGVYATNLTALVHLKAAQMPASAQPQAQPAAPAQQPGGVPQ